MHGGAFLTMFYFIKKDQILMESTMRKKFVFHLFWALPYIFIQYLHWHIKKTHVYGFIMYFSWIQIFVFELSLYLLAVSFDYYFTIRHGFKISM